jgi:hypothetical protein
MFTLFNFPFRNTEIPIRFEIAPTLVSISLFSHYLLLFALSASVCIICFCLRYLLLFAILNMRFECPIALCYVIDRENALV